MGNLASAAASSGVTGASEVATHTATSAHRIVLHVFIAHLISNCSVHARTESGAILTQAAPPVVTITCARPRNEPGAIAAGHFALLSLPRCGARLTFPHRSGPTPGENSAALSKDRKMNLRPTLFT